MRTIRERVLRGEPFPAILQPRHCWFDGMPIEEM
jgi:hypothetical protein